MAHSTLRRLAFLGINRERVEIVEHDTSYKFFLPFLFLGARPRHLTAGKTARLISHQAPDASTMGTATLIARPVVARKPREPRAISQSARSRLSIRSKGKSVKTL